MVLTAVIEMLQGSSYKYEIDKTTGELSLDRVLGIQIPFNYGFIPDTLCDDGDALDVFVVSMHDLIAKSHVKVEIIGVYKCIDNGQQDDKLVGVLSGEGKDLDQETITGIKNYIEFYLNNYKPGFQVLGFFDATEASDIYYSSTAYALGEQNA